MMDRRIGRLALEVAVDADPVHLAALAHLILADHRDVVLGVAGDDASVAADARREVDGHAPGRALVGMRRVEGHVLGGLLDHLAREVGLAAELLERRLADEMAALHAVMLLRRRQADSCRPVFASATPRTIHGASLVRIALASKPTPLPTRPARCRP